MDSAFAALLASLPSCYSPSASSYEVTVSTEEFHAFHKIDRELFTRLVLGLNRNINESLEVFGFLYTLEQAGYVRNLIAYLLSLPDAHVDAMANEVVVCLTFLYNKEYATAFFIANNNSDVQSIIPLMIRTTGGRVSLMSIHQNRETFLAGLRTHLNDVCLRAFDDICARADSCNRERMMALEREKAIMEMNQMRLNVQEPPRVLHVVHPPPPRVQQERVHVHVPPRLQEESKGKKVAKEEPINRMRFHQQERLHVPPRLQQERLHVHVPPRVQEESKAKVTKEKEKEEEEGVLAPDDRTVFLTFSKGYAISEDEVRVFFTKKFGELIEEVEMQEVEEKEQPLYAKMVLKMSHASKMDEIVSSRSRNKFTINGKHMWARKYVRKSPTITSASSSSLYA